MFEELRNSCSSGGVGGFLPGMKQIANVAALPGIVGVSRDENLINTDDLSLLLSVNMNIR